jgi:ketosteroid isomerase-like protein
MTATGDAMNEETVVTRVLADYYAAFSTLEVHAVLPYFHEPSVLIGPQAVLAAPTYAVLTTAITPAMEGLRARGFGRSELSVRNVNSLSATATLVTGVAVRYKVDGQELERVGVTYVLHKADTRWKIAVLIVHDANEVAATAP